ncbi:MAG TPA: LPS export ABC transporter permease LptG [Candidatus Binatia bacterium]|jgi:lipopolysaccharide export system permease protein
MTPASALSLPIIPRYILKEFLRLLGLCMLGFILIYVLVDFFDRFGTYLKYRPPARLILAYFVFKIPLIVTQLVPVATLAGVLLGLGMMGRHNEITAMRASGLSTIQIARPLLVAAAALSIAIFVWNESVVPYCSERFRHIDNIEIKNKPQKALLDDQGIWFHGKAGIYNIEQFDARKATIVGLTVYDFTPGFELQRVVEIPSARWQNGRWTLEAPVERKFDSAGNVLTRDLTPADFSLPDPPADLQVMQKEPDEMSFSKLRRHVRELARKGIDTTESMVDLHLKLAIPCVTLAMVLIGVPLAMRSQRQRSFAANAGLGLTVGFSYWVLLALAVSLGHGGAIPPIIAAWMANLVFGVLGAFLFLGVE